MQLDTFRGLIISFRYCGSSCAMAVVSLLLERRRLDVRRPDPPLSMAEECEFRVDIKSDRNGAINPHWTFPAKASQFLERTNLATD